MTVLGLAVHALFENGEPGAVVCGQLGEAAKTLPPQLYRRYDLIRQKRGTAISQTNDGTCNSCHMALPPQLFHRLRREPILEQCPSCNRIIYFVAPQPISASAPERG